MVPGKNVRGKNVRGNNVRGKNVRGKNVRRKNVRVKNIRRKNVRGKNVKTIICYKLNVRIRITKDFLQSFQRCFSLFSPPFSRRYEPPTMNDLGTCNFDYT